MEWVASTLHTTSEHGVSSITTADAHTSAASSRFKWTRPFRRKTKSGFCACAITFQTQSTPYVFVTISAHTCHQQYHFHCLQTHSIVPNIRQRYARHDTLTPRDNSCLPNLLLKTFNCAFTVATNKYAITSDYKHKSPDVTTAIQSGFQVRS